METSDQQKKMNTAKDLKEQLGFVGYEKVEMESLINKQIVIKDAISRIGDFGVFYILLINIEEAKEDNTVATASPAIVKVVEKAISEKAFPFSGKIISVPSTKRKGKNYFDIE